MTHTGAVPGNGSIVVAIGSFVFAVGIAFAWFIMPIAELPLLVAGALIGLVIAIWRPLIPCLVCVGVVGFRIQDAYTILYPLKLPILTSLWALVALASTLLAGKSNLSLPPAFRWMVGLVLVTMVSIIFGIDPGRGWDYFTESYIKILIVIFTLLFVVRTSEDIAITNFVTVLFGVLIALIVVRNKLEGIDLVEGSRVTIGRDLGSPLRDPNDLALILLVPLSFAIALVFRGPRSMIIVGIIGAGVILLAIVFTQSRGGMLGVMALFLVFGSRLVKSKLTLVILALLAGAAIYFGTGIGQRNVSSSIESGLDESASIRLDLWILAIRTFIANPLMGIGMDTFPIIAAVHTGLAFPTHNTWLQVLVETGILGFGAFCGMVWSGFRAASANSSWFNTTPGRNSTHAASLASLASLCGFCASSFFITHGFTWTIYFIVCLAAVTQRAVQRRL